MEIQDIRPLSPVQTPPPPPPVREAEKPAEPESPTEKAPLPENSANILELYA